ncbi:MAG: TVP38/TMEM64 family protein [Alphaproteobacteria bacterium]
MNNKSMVRFIGALLLLIAVIVAWKLRITDYLNLEFIRSQQVALKNYYSEYPFVTVGLFFIIYVVVAALSLPGAAVMTLLGGALLGFWKGLIAVSFASTIGATLAFLLSRFLLQDWIQGRYQKQLTILNDGFKKEGTFYLFALRLIPAFPFFLVNIMTSVMPIKTRDFYRVSQLGMLPGTAVYVYAGTELGKIQSLSDITSPSLLAAFAVLGLFPLIAKKIVAIWRNRRKA